MWVVGTRIRIGRRHIRYQLRFLHQIEIVGAHNGAICAHILIVDFFLLDLKTGILWRFTHLLERFMWGLRHFFTALQSSRRVISLVLSTFYEIFTPGM